ncbi:MAG TPA: HAD family hydrolase [Mycobacteriales bacterium]|nr:HAD family hydrolase [Mycobacteriales bacterium]
MSRRLSPFVDAVIVDLDDTLYPQADFLDAAWDAVARTAGEHGAPSADVRIALHEVAAKGSDRGQIIDRAMSSWPTVPTASLVAAFYKAVPDRLWLYPGARPALAELRHRSRLALVSDGNVSLQRSKLAALGLAGIFDVIVWTDLWGRTLRKPHPFGMLLAAAHMGTRPSRVVVIGDRPDKDVTAALDSGMLAIRVTTGEYRHDPSPEGTWLTVPTFADAVQAVLPHLPSRLRRHQIERRGLQNDQLSRVT